MPAPAVADRFELLLMRFARSIIVSRRAALRAADGNDWEAAVAESVARRAILHGLLANEHQRRYPDATQGASGWWADSRAEIVTMKARWLDPDTGVPTRTPMTSEPDEEATRVAAALRWLAHLTVYVAAQDQAAAGTAPPKASAVSDLAAALMAADLAETDPKAGSLTRHVRAWQAWDELLTEVEKETR